MSVEDVNWALAKRVGNGQLKATLVAIACVCNDEHKASREDLEREMNRSGRTVARHLKLLRFLNLIEFDRDTVILRVMP